MLYKHPERDEEGRRVLGWCDGCEIDLYPADPHWLILLPGQRKITALCKRCRDWMLQSLDFEDNWTDTGMYEFRHGGKMKLIDNSERLVLIAQLDDDECIEEEDDEV